MKDEPRPSDELLAAIVTSSNDAIVSLTLGGVITSWNPAAEQLFGYSAAEAIGQPAWLLHPPGHEHAFPLPVAMLSAGELIEPYQTQRTRKDGHVLDLMLTLWAIRGASGRVIGVAATFRDVTEQTDQGHTSRFDSHRVFEHQLRALTRVSSSLTFDQPIEVTLDALAAGVVDVTHAVSCAVALIDDDHQSYRVTGTFGLPSGYATAVEHAYSAGAQLSSLEAYRTLLPVQRTLSQYIRHDPRQTLVASLVQDEDWDCIVSLPLIFRGSAVGAVTFFYPTGVEPDEQELGFLSVVADQAALAVQTARLFAEVQGKAALEERQRLASELHDSVSQALFGIGLGARTARTLLERDPAKAIEPLDFVVTLAEAGLTEMRALIFELRPDALETEGLVRLLEQQAAALRSRHGISVTTDFDAEPAVAMPVKEMLYRIAQESLHNTTKHARATSVTLSMRHHEETIVLDVIDDGVGFDPDATFPGHLGLRSMRERVSRHGATITITSAPEAGTRIRVTAPAFRPGDLSKP